MLQKYHGLCFIRQNRKQNFKYIDDVLDKLSYFGSVRWEVPLVPLEKV